LINTYASQKNSRLVQEEQRHKKLFTAKGHKTWRKTFRRQNQSEFSKCEKTENNTPPEETILQQIKKSKAVGEILKILDDSPCL
jgi:hypothetical protein